MKLKNFVEKNYSSSLKYLKESKKYIIFSILFFCTFFIFGLFISPPEEFSLKIIEYLEELVGQTEGFGFFEMFRFIFVNNSLVGFFSIVFGSILGIFPLISVMANGFILGFVSNMSIASGGILSLWRILPHGIFELPAIFICFGLGIKLGFSIFHKNYVKEFKHSLEGSLRVFLFIVLPLLFLAGIIESILIVLF